LSAVISSEARITQVLAPVNNVTQKIKLIIIQLIIINCAEYCIIKADMNVCIALLFDSKNVNYDTSVRQG
jgi:hypothetical protein